MFFDSGGQKLKIGTPEEVRAVLVQCFGNRTQAARRLGFQSPTHFRRWLKAHKTYDRACDAESVRDEVNAYWAEIGENCIAKAAANGDIRAISKILNDKCADRGWGSHDRDMAKARAEAKQETEGGSVRDLVALFKKPAASSEEDTSEEPPSA